MTHRGSPESGHWKLGNGVVFTRTMATRIGDHLHCPSCLEIFKDPVMLPCSHSFCRACVEQCWERNADPSCPLCTEKCDSKDVPSNLALRNVCEAFAQASEESEDTCSLHKDALNLFCLDHQELVCLICRDAKNHNGHKFRPLDEVVIDHQEKLQECLQDAKKRLKDYSEIRDNCNKQATYLKIQGDQVESTIKKDFEELRHFLQFEEDARVATVREEVQRKSRTMKEMIEELAGVTDALADVIRSTEEQLRSDPVPFMKNFEDTITKIQKLPGEPELLPGALLDEVKHVGNLKFSVWERMKELVFYSPVLLDPNTAASVLVLSDHLTSVCLREGQQRPKNPERFQLWNRVLGSALASGTHVWDVEVGDNPAWALGVASGDPCLPHDMKTWSVAFCDGQYRRFAEPYGSWNPPVKLQRIQIRVDTSERSFAFSESLTNTELCNVKLPNCSQLSDSVKMFPLFWTRDEIPLQIIPLACRGLTLSQG
ncbi:E3 ubiquitin-protein ligase TRIM35-like [Festucalex cinctus]